MSSTPTIPKGSTKIDLDDLSTAETDEEWWMIEHDDRELPCGCHVTYIEGGLVYSSERQRYERVMPGHPVIVWAEQDDPNMLEVALFAQKVFGRNPRIVRYKEEIGSPVAYYEWKRLWQEQK